MLFDEFKLTKETLQGLRDANFTTPTPIQRDTLPAALEQRDIQAQAKTGSGKTLAFLIPVLERLHALNWNREDGLGALIISPTRELALQIFKVLKQVGKHHSFSAGLLIGGKDLKQEQDRVQFMNILICTPGRLLQHLDTSIGFDCSALKVLVFDEADRLLDLGFKKTIDAIVGHLAKDRQTLLFSATLSPEILDLARLSLKNPLLVSVDKDAPNVTPKNLQQRYLVAPLYLKLDVLFSFIKSHLKQKMIVFLSSCKQVRFVFESFCKLQPGIPLLCLHGKQNQQKRIGIFEQFSKKNEGCLFATDIAARGLDIPAVDWVLQVDCPDDVDTYIHRVGRTARYNSKGQALLFLLPSEVKFIEMLEEKKVPIEEIKINPKKQISIKSQLASFCSQSPDLKYLAQKAFICYMRSIYLQKHKEVFDVHQLPAEEFAEALGLVGAPKIKFKGQKNNKNTSRQLEQLDNKPFKLPEELRNRIKEGKSDSDDEVVEKKQKPKTKIDKLFAHKNNTVLSEHYTKIVNHEEEDDDDLLTLARKDHDVSDDEVLERKLNKKATKLKRRMAELGTGNRMVFDEEGNAKPAYELQDLDTVGDIGQEKVEFYQKGKEHMQIVDKEDKEAERTRRRLEKRERKLKEKNLRREESGPVKPVTLASAEVDEEVMVGSDYESGKDYQFSENDEDVMIGSDYDSGKDYQFSEDEPTFDDNDDESVSSIPKTKKRKANEPKQSSKTKKIIDDMSREELEKLALCLL